MILDQMNYEALLVPLNKFYDLHIGGSRSAGLLRRRGDSTRAARARPELRCHPRRTLGNPPRKASDPSLSRAGPDAVQHLGASRPAPGLEDLSFEYHRREAGGVLRAVPENDGPAGWDSRALRGVLLDSRGGQVDPGARRPVPGLFAISPRPARAGHESAVDPAQGPGVHLEGRRKRPLRRQLEPRGLQPERGRPCGADRRHPSPDAAAVRRRQPARAEHHEAAVRASYHQEAGRDDAAALQLRALAAEAKTTSRPAVSSGV